jgi:hypothetical protein
VRSGFRLVVVLVAGALVLPALAQEEKKGPKGKPAEEKKEGKEKKDPKDKAKPAAEKKDVKDKVASKEKLVPVAEYAARIARLPGEEGSQLSFEVPVGNRWERTQMPLGDDVKVRVMDLPPVYDDKGKLRAPTSKEKQDARGPDRKLPGYTGSLEDLKPGQYVRLTVVKRAGYKPAKGVKDVPPEYQPFINVIVVLGETPK